MAQLSEEIISLLTRLIVESPYGGLLALELVEAEEDCVSLRMPYRSEVTVCDSEGKEIAVALVTYKLSAAT